MNACAGSGADALPEGHAAHIFIEQYGAKLVPHSVREPIQHERPQAI